MKREWAGVARALRERDDCLGRGDDLLWADFKSRLDAKPRAAFPAWRFILTGAFTAAAALALLIPFLVSRFNPPAIRGWAEVRMDAELRVEKSRRFQASPGNSMQADAGSRLVRQSTNASRMELRLLAGGLLIDNQDPSAKNLIHCGPYLIEEWGTRYRVESGDSGFSVRVESGKVRVSREGEEILLDAGERIERPWPSAPTRATNESMARRARTSRGPRPPRQPLRSHRYPKRPHLTGREQIVAFITASRGSSMNGRAPHI
jgi:ferric-dicitrate binding protein FerR (iron transport regulator)